MSHNPRRLPVSLNGVSFQVDREQLQRGFLPAQRQPLDTGTEPGEQSLNPLGLWRKLLTDWSLGAGQKYQDISTSSDRQFYDSKGVDCWTSGELSLLPAMESISGGLTVTSGGRLFNAGRHLYWLLVDSGTAKIYYTTDALAGTPTWTLSTGYAGTVNSPMFAFDGSSLYVQGTSGTYKASPGGAWSVWSASSNTFLFFARGRLFGHDGTDVLYEYDGAGVRSSLHTLDEGVWRDLTDAPNGVYLSSHTMHSSGSEYEFTNARIWFIGIKSDGSLATPIEMARLPDGEGCFGLHYYGGMLTILTTKGIRLGVINGDNTVTFGPLLGLDSENDIGPRYVTSTGEFAYVGTQGLDAYYDGTNVNGLVRLGLAEFTEPLTPRFANDMSPGVAIGDTAFLGAVVHRDRLFISAGNAVYRQSANKATTGEVLSGWIRYGVSENKIPRALDVRHEPLPAGASVKVYVVDEDDTATLVGTSSTTGAKGPDAPFSITTIDPGEKFRVKVELNRATDTTTGPVVTSVALYSIPVPSRSEQFLLPLELASTVTDEGGAPVTFDVDTVYSDLRDLVKNRAVVTLELGGESYSVTVENVELRPEEGRRWDDDRTAVEGRVWVTCQTADLQVA